MTDTTPATAACDPDMTEQEKEAFLADLYDAEDEPVGAPMTEGPAEGIESVDVPATAALVVVTWEDTTNIATWQDAERIPKRAIISREAL